MIRIYKHDVVMSNVYSGLMADIIVAVAWNSIAPTYTVLLRWISWYVGAIESQTTVTIISA